MSFAEGVSSSQVPQVMVGPSKKCEVEEFSYLSQEIFGRNPKTAEAFFRWLEDPNYCVVSARNENGLIGAASVKFDIQPDIQRYQVFGERVIDFISNQKIGWYLTMFVAPRYRKLGVGKILAKSVTQWLHHKGCTVLAGTSWVSGSDDNSTYLYRRAGFELLGESQDFLRRQLIELKATCSACQSESCDCRSLFFGRSFFLDLQ